MATERSRPGQKLFVGEGGKLMTPEQVDRQRLVAQALLAKAGDTSPVGHWTAALNRGLQGFTSSWQNVLADRGEEAGMSAADALVAPYLGGTPTVTASSMGGTAGGAPNFTPAAAPDPLAPSMGTEGPIYPNEMTPGGYAMGEVVPTGSDAASIKAGLMARGLPEHVADGFIMNFMDESGLNPGINEIAPIVPGSRGGFGLYQLTGPRRTAYEQFAAQRGVDPSDVDAQLDWLMYELGGPEKNAAQAIMAAPDAGSAGAAIVDHFLRPAPEHEAARIAKYTGGGNVTASTMGGSPVASALMSGPGSAELLGLMADPWVARKYGPVLQALAGQAGAREQAQFEYAMKTQDPMYALGLEKAQLELDALRNPGAPKPIEVGGVLLDPVTFEPIFDSRTPDPGYRTMTPEEVLAVPNLDPGKAWQISPNGEIKQIGGGGVNINLGDAGQQMGSIPAGMAAVKDPTNPSGWRLETIPGGPAAAEAAAAEEKATLAGQNALTATDVVTSAAARAREANERRKVGGIFGEWATMNPGSENAELYRQVDVLKSNAKVENLNAMRAASPTGGALGSVTEKEADMLAAKSGALNPASPYFERDLADYELTLLRTVHGYDQGSAMFDQMYPEGVAGVTGGSKSDIPAGVADADPNADLLRKYGLE